MAATHAMSRIVQLRKSTLQSALGTANTQIAQLQSSLNAANAQPDRKVGLRYF